VPLPCGSNYIDCDEPLAWESCPVRKVDELENQKISYPPYGAKTFPYIKALFTTQTASNPRNTTC